MIEQNDIGPHEGIEFELISQGKKDIAVFGFDYPNLQAVFNQAKKLNLEEYTFEINPNQSELVIKFVIFYRKGFDVQANTLKENIKLSVLGRSENWQEIERKIGLLLGYSEKQIQAYIDFMTSRHGIE